MKNQQEQDIAFLKKAIQLAKQGMDSNNGGPFGAIVVRNNKIIGQGFNRVLSSLDPTAHAEVTAIRDACQNIQSYQLDDCVIYSSCEPCPMCLGAIYWARPKRLVFALTRKDAARIGFDDDFIYEEIVLPLDQRRIPTQRIFVKDGPIVFEEWVAKEDKHDY